MPKAFLPTNVILEMLGGAPARIAELTSGLAPDLLLTPPAPGDWPANEVLAHLRACADMWGGCIEAILTQDHPTLTATNPRTWITKTDYLELEFQPSLAAYTAQRAALVTVLEPLDERGWSRSATVRVAGKPLERSVHFYADWLASHERQHIKQIGRIVTALRQ